MSRKEKLLSPAIADLLIKQLHHEFKNFLLYRSFANYFSVEGIVALEKYFRLHSEEEMKHHNWIYDYLTDADIIVKYEGLERDSAQDFKSMIDPFELSIDREIQTTQMIYNIYSKAEEEKDFMTQQWLRELLIKEQIEEENTSRMALSIMELDADLLEKAEEVLELLED